MGTISAINAISIIICSNNVIILYKNIVFNLAIELDNESYHFTQQSRI
jgi:hypothetical protein